MAVSWTPHQLAWTASEGYSKWALFCKSLVNFPIPAMFIFEASELIQRVLSRPNRKDLKNLKGAFLRYLLYFSKKRKLVFVSIEF